MLPPCKLALWKTLSAVFTAISRTWPYFRENGKYRDLIFFAFLHNGGRSHGFHVALEISSLMAINGWVINQIRQHNIFSIADPITCSRWFEDVACSCKCDVYSIYAHIIIIIVASAKSATYSFQFWNRGGAAQRLSDTNGTIPLKGGMQNSTGTDHRVFR